LTAHGQANKGPAGELCIPSFGYSAPFEDLRLK
jgi:hypothetical protein